MAVHGFQRAARPAPSTNSAAQGAFVSPEEMCNVAAALARLVYAAPADVAATRIARTTGTTTRAGHRRTGGDSVGWNSRGPVSCSLAHRCAGIPTGIPTGVPMLDGALDAVVGPGAGSK